MGVDDTLGQSIHALQHPPARAGTAGLSTTAALPRAPGTTGLSRLQRSFVGRRAEVIEVTRVLDAPVAQVTAALGRITPRAPYFLELKTFDGSLVDGGVAGFRMPTSAAAMVASPLAITGARSLDVDVGPAGPAAGSLAAGAPRAGGGTRLTIRLPLADLATRFSHVGAATTFLGSACTGGVAVAVAKGAVAVALLGVPFAVAFGLALPLGCAISCLTWQHREAQLRTILGELADAIVLDVRLGGAFAGGALPPTTAGDGGLDAGSLIALGI